MVTSVIDGTHYSANDMMKLHYIMIAIWRKKKKTFQKATLPIKAPRIPNSISKITPSSVFSTKHWPDCLHS